MKRSLLIGALVVVSAGVGLVACGGGGSGTGAVTPPGGGAPVVPPVVPPAPLASTCTATQGGITLSAGAVRASGVSPLAVMFDATATTHANPAVKPFHDIEYRWSFGDPGSGNWAVGARPGGGNGRNSATGPIASHLYEPAPGSGTLTYTIDVFAFDGTDTATCQIQITVDDPNVVFSGAATTCVSDTADFTGCPAGANQVTTNNFVTATGLVTPGNSVRRLLFRRGGTWNAAFQGIVTAPGPGLIGAFGAGARPLIRSTANNPIIALSSPGTPTFSDWRVMDLELDGLSSGLSRGVQTSGGVTQATLLRLDIKNVDNGIIALSGVNADQLAIFDSSVAVTTNVPVYFQGLRIALMGNTISSGGPAHTVRIEYLAKGVLSNNVVSNAGAGLHNLKLHGPDFGLTGLFTEQLVISDNKFEGGVNGQTVTMEPQNNLRDERLRNVIFERNWLTSGAVTDTGVLVSGSEFSLRNNIINMTGGSLVSTNSSISILRRGIEPAPDFIRVENNTGFTSSASTGFRVVRLDATATNVVVRNNLGYAPNVGIAEFLLGSGGGGLVQSNNSTNFDVKNTNPNFVNATPAVPADFALQAGSYAENSGIANLVFSDFFRLLRPQAGVTDRGAVERP